MSMPLHGVDPVNFDLLESQKENIEPLQKGRSVTYLAKAFENDAIDSTGSKEASRLGFEEEIRKSNELDDPLEVWVRYVAWTKNAYPAGHSAGSDYIQLLECCSKQFIQEPHYRNDPRYLRIWIEYARYSDDPREMFSFLARNDIGQELATFYEEYAAFLEVRNRKGQADEVYQMGLLREARPVQRLRRKYEEFLARLAASPAKADEPNSPPIAAVRPALTIKFGGVEAVASTNTTSKTPKTKLQVFTDETEPSATDHVGSGGWGSIGTLQSRRKENIIEMRKMAGEKMPQQSQGRTTSKLEIFKDDPTIQLNAPVVPPKRHERVVCDLEAIYAIQNSETSFEELKAQAMGLLNMNWPDVDLSTASELACQPGDVYVSVMDTESPSRDDKRDAFKRQMASPTINTKAAMDDILGLFSQPLKCEQSDDSSESGSEDEEPDNTFAVDRTDNTLPRTGTQDTAFSDYHSDIEEAPRLEKPNGFDLPEHGPSGNCEESVPTVRGTKNAVPATPQQQVSLPSRVNGFDLMTPITEDTENLHMSLLRRKSVAIIEEPEDNSEDEPDNELYSSPFIENPPPRPLITNGIIPPKRPLLKDRMKEQTSRTPGAERLMNVKQGMDGPVIQESICNPMDLVVRETITSLLRPQISEYDGCQKADELSYGKKFEAIEKYIRALNKKGSDATQHLEVVLDFNSKYAIKKKLGEGAFAPVFLVENISGFDLQSRRKLEALKIEKPGSAWEFYIMRHVQKSLSGSRAINSVAAAHELYQFADCSFLILEYRDQGTILDLVNMNRTENGGVDELLAIFLSVELLRTVETLHSKGIMHGDLKADNCLLRLEPTSENEWSSVFQRDGSAGWSHKGITLIDFGRGINMKHFESNVQFIADWKTDEQDCAEMREARPWTYQIDYHGLACIIHSLLFGKYIETVNSGGLGAGRKQFRLRHSLKRYWKQEIWEPLFDLLLNPMNSGQLPVTDSLRSCRERMERYLEDHGTAGIGLKGLIRKAEIDISLARRK